MVRRRPCQSATCRRAGGDRGRAGDAGFLCGDCRHRLVGDLLHLPALYAHCDRSPRPEVVRVVRKVPRKSAAADSMSPAATEVRSAIRTVLASWAGLVVAERGVPAPSRDVPELVRFLCRHTEWLSGHPAVVDMVAEVRELGRAARAVAYPSNVRRVPVGCCPAADCQGELLALMRPHGDPLPSEIVCTLSPDHTWPVTWWTRLARQIRGSRGESA